MPMPTRMLTGVFTHEHALLAAARSATARGLAIRDAFTPFPVHGLEDAAGFPPSRLPLVCFGLGALGMGAALAFQLWASAVDWPVNIGGKSFTALPALAPIAFEVTVLAAALGTVLAFLVRARLWPGRGDPVFAGVTDDRFALLLELDDAAVDAARALLAEHGAVDIEEATR